MGQSATVEEVRQIIEEELASGRQFADIRKQLSTGGVPDKVIRQASTVRIQKTEDVTLLAPNDWKDESLTRATRIFAVVTIMVLAFLLSMLLRALR